MNTIRYATDTFGNAFDMTIPVYDDSGSTPTPDPDDEPVVAPFIKSALLISKKALDCTNKSHVQFQITGTCPTGCKRRFIFKIDDVFYYFKNNTLTEFPYEVNADNVCKYGNKGSTLNGYSIVRSFIGKKIYPVIALQAPSDAEDFPTAKVQLKTQASSETLTDTVESPVYVLSEETVPKIESITYESEIQGDASITVKVRLQADDESWSDYMSLTNAANKSAVAVQFKITYKVTKTDGTDAAQLTSIVVNHTSGKSFIAGNTAEIFSVVADYENDLQTCYVIVRHSELFDSTITAYCNFMNEPARRDLIFLGNATGARQDLILGVDGVKDTGIDPSTLELFAGDAALTDYIGFNTEISTVTINVKKNTPIYASYEYNHGMEVWNKMTAQYTQPYNDDENSYMTRFVYRNDAAGKKVANVRISLKRKTGSVSAENLGTATGKKQLFTLKHMPKPSTIKFPNVTNPVDFSYDDDSNILVVTAKKGTELKCKYSWIGEPITIYGYAAGWSVL